MNSKTIFSSLATVFFAATLSAQELAPSIEIPFDQPSEASRFLTVIPNKNTEIRDGVLWTHGSSGGKYPPMVYLPVEGTDLDISFRYRHLSRGGWLWFFVDGDDGYGGTDHMLRVKLLRNGVQLQIDSHTLDPKHPQLQAKRDPDPVSHAYRLNEILPLSPVDLSANEWREVTIRFDGDSVSLSVDGATWQHSMTRSCFNATKRKLLWMQNGGEQGIELDNIQIFPHRKE